MPIYEPVQSFVDDLKHTRVGLLGKPFTVDELKSGSLSQVDDCDRFRLSFQIADNVVSWEIIFDKSSPLSPPDIVFGEDDEEFNISLDELKGYYDWDPGHKSCLSNMLLNVLREYSQYKREQISSLTIINEQWKDLCENTNYATDCEVYCSSSGNLTYNATASFMFEFVLDLSELPPYFIRAKTGDNRAILQISFQAPNLTKVIPRLHLSSKMENAFGGTGMTRLPPYGGSDLKSYVEKVDVLFANTVNEISERYKRRKELGATILAEFHGSVIEYDPEGFNEISLLLSHSAFFFVLHVILGDKYPTLPPVLVLQSIYHRTSKGLLRQTFKEYRYSPRWSSKMVVEAIRQFIEAVVPEFKQFSIKNGMMI